MTNFVLLLNYYSVFFSDSSFANGNTSLDLDSSFTTDILGRAGLSQFINTPKKKLQEMQLNKQALLRSIAEQNFTVSVIKRNIRKIQ